MKSFIVAVCIFACASATVLEKDAQVVHSSQDQTPEGNFNYSFGTDNGIDAQASGQLKTVGKDEVALEQSGSFSYKDPEGKTISVTFIANENGYQPQGDHLPTPPPTQAIPEYILKANAWALSHPYTEKQ